MGSRRGACSLGLADLTGESECHVGATAERAPRLCRSFCAHIPDLTVNTNIPATMSDPTTL